MNYNYQVIDLKNYPRRKQYEWFKTFSNPTFSLNVNVDVTEVLNYSHQTKTSFFINFLYVVMKSLNSIDEMRLRIVNDEIRLYEVVHPTYTVMTNSGIFENAGTEMKEDYHEFYKAVHQNIEEVKKITKVKDSFNDSNYFNDYYITCLPWLEVTSMTHPIPDNNIESSSVPRICWCKYYQDNERYILSFNLTCSHILVDGYPACMALNKLKDNALNCLELFK